MDGRALDKKVIEVRLKIDQVIKESLFQKIVDILKNSTLT